MRLTPGTRLTCRGLSWEVLGVDPSGPQTRLRLRCAEGDLVGHEWDALHPWDQVEPREMAPRLNQPAGARAWWLHHAAQLADRIPADGPAIAAHPGRLRVEPWQLVPLRRALEMPRVRLLLADGVGLGKTIQAGLVIAELIQRRRAHRVIIVAPPGPLLRQWAEELRIRFGLRPTLIAGSADLRALRDRLELGGNAFDAVSLCLTSIDFAKQDPVLAELERTGWDLAIIDEAHHCCADTARPTHRRRLAEVLAARADGLLLLSATPHDGEEAHFGSLLALLDPSLVDDAMRPLGQAYRRHVVRRLKAHVRDPDTGRPAFRPRAVLPMAVTLTAPDHPVARFHQALSDLMARRLQPSPARSARPGDTLALIGLLKRGASTVAAALATLAVVADCHQADPDMDAPARRRERTRVLRAYRRRAMRHGVLSAAEEDEQAVLEAEGIAAHLREDAHRDTAADLRAVIALGRAAEPLDPKCQALCAAIRAIRAAEPDANVLVYTEYADSQDAACAALAASGIAPVLTIRGADGDGVRADAADRFSTEAGLVLVSTDSLSEGLNLQRRCHHLIHLDLPYNPNRLEQRNGRIDRYGQAEVPVIRYLYLAGTFEERLLLRLIAKYERARAELEVMPDTLGVTADPADRDTGLLRGLAQRQAPLFPPPHNPIRTLDAMAETQAEGLWRDLWREVDHAYGDVERLAARHGWMGLPAGSNPEAATPIDVAPQVDPFRFLVHAIRAAGGAVEAPDPAGAVVCAPPVGWHFDPTGLPGDLGDARRIRLVAQGAATADEPGDHAAGRPGWPHPLIRRAAERLRMVPDAGPDPRVAWTVAPDGRPAAILTFLAEARTASASGAHPVWRDVIAVRLDPGGATTLLSDPAAWLRAPEADDPPVGGGDAVPSWLDAHAAGARAAAMAAAERIGQAVAQSRQVMAGQVQAALDRWLSHHARTLCGSADPPIGDLFGAPRSGPGWRADDAPHRRLDAFRRDATRPLAERELAGAILDAHDRRQADIAGLRGALAIDLAPLGILLLRPDRP